MNEEIADKSIRFAAQSGKVTVRTMIRVLRLAYRLNRSHQAKKQNKKIMKAKMKQIKANTPVRGKQSVKELIGQGQGVSSIPIGEDIRDFKRIANKYGVDFAIVKDKNQEPPLYTVFFKAKDVDAIGILRGMGGIRL